MDEKKHRGIICLISVIVTMIICVLSVMSVMGCKSAIKMPKGLNKKCQISWAYIIAFHESGKNEGTKSAMTLLLQSAQKECFESIDKERLRKTALICRDSVYGTSDVDLGNLQKKEMFTNCMKLHEGEIK